jgi:hypothetical protein
MEQEFNIMSFIKMLFGNIGNIIKYSEVLMVNDRLNNINPDKQVNLKKALVWLKELERSDKKSLLILIFDFFLEQINTRDFFIRLISTDLKNKELVKLFDEIKEEINPYYELYITSKKFVCSITGINPSVRLILCKLCCLRKLEDICIEKFINLVFDFDLANDFYILFFANLRDPKCISILREIEEEQYPNLEDSDRMICDIAIINDGIENFNRKYEFV